MGMRLNVKIGPFALCRYNGERPNIDALGNDIAEIQTDEKAKIVWVGSNLLDTSIHIDQECDPEVIEEGQIATDVAWFRKRFAKELVKIETLTGHAPEVLWGFHAAVW